MKRLFLKIFLFSIPCILIVIVFARSQACFDGLYVVSTTPLSESSPGPFYAKHIHNRKTIQRILKNLPDFDENINLLTINKEPVSGGNRFHLFYTKNGRNHVADVLNNEYIIIDQDWSQVYVVSEESAKKILEEIISAEGDEWKMESQEYLNLWDRITK